MEERKPDEVEHKIMRLSHDNVGWWCVCYCGAKWSQPATRSHTFMMQLFDNHVAYAKRIATRVD